MRRGLRQSRAHGFTLLEAVVAMALAATVGMALFGWINANLIALSRVDETRARAEATINVVEYMQRVNPMATAEGDAKLGRHQVKWRAVAKTPVVDGIDHPRGLGLYQFALYDVVISVSEEGGQPWFSFDMQQVGYKKVRSAGIVD